ncbi:hypothetical protein CTAYLR_005748 [Chrysophaeum taylorii]|uniref:Na+/H+ antiporter n=1 Tax=Chrysophaeum taylorii TaxID=2483200 RepID=A0AAD7XPG9_9STRA|nr:hypothetical protein CTAYLR_005748 [Chrysophaeum taylorii]
MLSSSKGVAAVHPEDEGKAKETAAAEEPCPQELFFDEERVTMFSAQHLFAEMHVYHHDVWYETHRWNYGLQQHLISGPASRKTTSQAAWSKPQLSKISVAALLWLRDQLKPELVLLDVAPELCAVVRAVVSALVSVGSLDEGDSSQAEVLLLAHLNSEKFVRETRLEDGEEDALAADADEEAVQILVDDRALAKISTICLVRLEKGERSTKTGFEEKTGKNLYARFICFIFGSTRFNPNGGQGRSFKFLNRASRDERLSFREVVPEHVVGIDLGCAMAMIMQDDSVVQTFYCASNASDVVSAIDQCLSELHVVPRMMCPTNRGVRARAKRMLQQMGRLTQEDKWLSKQENIFTQGSRYSIDGLVLAMEKFAIPLLAGICVAIILSNTRARSYDRWVGTGHATTSHDDDHASHSSNSTYNATTSSYDDDDDDDDGVSHPTIFGLRINGHDVTLHFIVNDVLMCLFFGLASKEIVEAFQPGGSLHPIKLAINPLAATLGGCFFPVLTYLLLVIAAYSVGFLNDSYSLGAYLNGWGIPTATDISIAWVTALWVFGPGHPAINFLLLLAVVDDGLGLVIIALAYPDPHAPLKPQWLGLVLLGMFVAYCLRRLNCAKWSPYVFIAGPFAWFGLLYASLHPSLALVFVVPFMPLKLESNILPTLKEIFSEELNANIAAGSAEAHAHSPLHEFEEATKTLVDFFVLFVFGIVNAGVKVDEVGPLTAIVVLALVIGKTLGITCASLVSERLGYGLPEGMRRCDLVCVGLISSVGLTVSLFISGEAFQRKPRLQNQAKMGALLSLGTAIVMTSLASSPIWTSMVPPQLPKRQFSVQHRRSSYMIEEVSLGEMVAKNMKQNMDKIHRVEATIEQATKLTREENRKVFETTSIGEKEKLIEQFRNRSNSASDITNALPKDEGS